MVPMQVCGDAAPVCILQSSGQAKPQMRPPKPAIDVCRFLCQHTLHLTRHTAILVQLPAAATISMWAHLLLFRSVLAQRKRSPLRSIGLPPFSKASGLLELAAAIAAGWDAAGTCRNVWQATEMQLTVGSCSGVWTGKLLPALKAASNRVHCIKRSRCQVLSRQS